MKTASKEAEFAYADAHCHASEVAGIRHGESAWSDENGWLSWLKGYEAAGVSILFMGGFNPEDWERQVLVSEFARQTCPSFKVMMSFGLHPWAVNKLTAQECATALQILREKTVQSDLLMRPVAIGECGLDFAHRLSVSVKMLQRDLFRQQCEMAVEAGLPVVVHSVRAHDATLEILAEFGHRLRAVMLHGFSGDKGVLARYLKLGPADRTFFSLGPASISKVQVVAGHIPPELLLVESDRGLSDGDGAQQLLSVAEMVGNVRREPAEIVLVRSKNNLMKFLGL